MRRGSKEGGSKEGGSIEASPVYVQFSSSSVSRCLFGVLFWAERGKGPLTANNFLRSFLFSLSFLAPVANECVFLPFPFFGEPRSNIWLII